MESTRIKGRDAITQAPHNPEAEMAVLGSLLIAPDCLSEIDLHPGDFFSESARWTFEAMLKLGDGINQITVAEELARAGHLQDVGGVAYLSQVVSVVPTSIHAAYYADIVRQYAYRRRLIVVAGQVAALAYSGEGDSVALHTKAQDILTKLQPHEASEIIMPKDHAWRMRDMVANRAKGQVRVLKFGYLDLDRFLGGMHGGNLVIVGARPGVGKSQWMQEVALYNCHHSVLIASAEMSLEEYDERDIAMTTGISVEKQRFGQLTDKEEGEIWELVSTVAGRPLYFLEGRISTDQIARKARILHQSKGLDLVVVDYLQLLRDSVERKAGDSLRERVTYISNNLKSLARELNIPILAASQLNRDVESRPDKRPHLSDLKESGSIEQDADIVLLLHRPELYKTSKAPDREPGILYVFIVKVRQLGKTGEVKLKWNEKERRYHDLAQGDT